MVPGQLIAPTLKLVRPLAKGAMGSVWVAEHIALGTQVAVKFMAASLGGHPELVERFQHEAMAAARIKSPHVAQVFDHGLAADGSPYIVMELLEGESLGQRVARRGPLPPAEVALIVAQAAKALAPAHRLGIVHRDIKPDNLFVLDVEGEPFVKVLDFGVAKQSPDQALPWQTSTGIMLGTPRYVSPEQSRSARRADHRADLWSLAAVAYFALTGTPPFNGATMAAVLVAVNEGKFEPPSQLRPELPPAVDAWMARALQRDPEARFGSAAEMAEALAAAVQAPTAARDGTVPRVDARVATAAPMVATAPPVVAAAHPGATVHPVVAAAPPNATAHPVGATAHPNATAHPMVATVPPPGATVPLPGATVPPVSTAPPISAHGGTAALAGFDPHGAGPGSAPPGTFQGVATTATGARALRGPLLIAAAALGALVLVLAVVWVAGGGGASGTQDREINAAPGAKTGENAAMTSGDRAAADAGSPGAAAPATARDAIPPPTPTATSSAPAHPRAPQGEDPRPSRPSTRKRAPEDDIGF